MQGAAGRLLLRHPQVSMLYLSHPDTKILFINCPTPSEAKYFLFLEPKLIFFQPSGGLG